MCAGVLSAPLHCAARRCEIHIFDPTLTDEQNKLMKSLPGITFHAYGLGAMDGEVRGAARRKAALQETADVSVCRRLKPGNSVCVLPAEI